jgi:hypothetical protein
MNESIDQICGNNLEAIDVELARENGINVEFLLVGKIVLILDI